MAAEATHAAAYDELAARYGLTYGHPDWLDEVIARYQLDPPTRGATVDNR